MFEDQQWMKIVSESGKFIRECKGKFTQHKIIHRYYWTPVRLNRMGVMNNSLCWKCQKDTGTLIHCLWECPIINRFWSIVVHVLSDGLGKMVPLCPGLCLLGDKERIANMLSDKFSVIIVGVSVAARVILKHWKTSKAPQVKEWVNMMIRMASYECMLYKLNNKDSTAISVWENFWSYITVSQYGDI